MGANTLDYGNGDAPTNEAPYGDLWFAAVVLTLFGGVGVGVANGLPADPAWWAIRWLRLAAIGVAGWMLIRAVMAPHCYRHARLRAVLAAALLASGGCFWFTHGYARLRDLNLRRCLSSCGGTTSLVNWARQAILTPKPPTVFQDSSGRITVQPATAGIPQGYDFNSAYYVRNARGVWHMELWRFDRCGDEFFQEGLLIGPPGFVPTEQHQFMTKWADGVWAYQDHR